MIKLLSSSDCFKKYGSPELEKGMTLWDVPKELEIGVIPKRLYCNKDLIAPLTKAFQNLIKTGFVNELKTWDGCFYILDNRYDWPMTPKSLPYKWDKALREDGKWYELSF